MQQQAAPAYAPPPPDAALQQRIDTLVSYAAKNGASGLFAFNSKLGGLDMVGTDMLKLCRSWLCA